MFFEDLEAVLPHAQIIFKLFLSLLGIVITILWQRYRKKKALLDFLKFRWAEQQRINLELLKKPENIDVFEKMVYGADYETTRENNKRLFLVFLHLNQILHLYLAMENKLLPEKKFDDLAKVTLRLFVREKKLIEFALKHRGYEKTFRDKIKNLYKGLKHYKRINWEKVHIKTEKNAEPLHCS